MLYRLFVEGSLASFGYFDAYYLFSSTLILIMSAVMNPSIATSDTVSCAFTILRTMKEDGNLPSHDYYERLQRTRNSVSKMREARDGIISTPALINNHYQMDTQVGQEQEEPPLGLTDGLLLDHPLIENFLEDKGLDWAERMTIEDQALRDLANELGDEFLFNGS